MLIAMVMMQSLEMSPIWLFCVVVVQFSHFSWSHILPFPLSPFPFPLSPFPFPLSPFPKYTNKLSAQTSKIGIKLKLSHTLLSTTGVQLLSKQGGLCFLWRLFSLGGGGREAGKHPIVGGGQGGGGNAIRIFSHFPHFFSHFLGRSLSVMFKRIHSSGIV